MHTLRETTMEGYIRLVLFALAAGGHQHCSDVPPCSLRHWFTLPSLFWHEESIYLPIAGLQIFLVWVLDT